MTLSQKEHAASLQCTVNILTTLHHIGSPFVPVVGAYVDRIYLAPVEDFINWLSEAKYPDGSYRFCEDVPLKSLHRRARKGWRERETFCALQICDCGVELEVDLDFGGVRTDLVGALVHAYEFVANWLFNKKTNPYKMRDSLKKFRNIDVKRYDLS